MMGFPTPEHLASWAGVSPGTRDSAGKRYPVRPPYCNKWLSAMLVEAAGSVGRMKGKNYLAAQHARLTARRGMSRAPGRRRALDPRLGLLHAAARGALPGTWVPTGSLNATT